MLGMALGACTFYVNPRDFMLAAFELLLACLAIMVVTTFIFPEPPKAEARPLIWEDWREPLRGQAGGRGLGNYRLAAGLVVAVFVALYLFFA
jgi:uncharacterized membrane protein YfcA